MNKNIFIVRHCKAEGQSAGAPLTEAGFLQAKELADFFRDRELDRIISSPFLRAVQSIEPVAKQKRLPIEEDSRLAERVLSSKSFPDWLDKLKATYADPDLTYEGGESSKDARNRIAGVIDEVAEGDFENVIIVTHGNIMSLLLNYFDKRFGFNEWKDLSNPDVFLLQLWEKGHYIERLWENEKIRVGGVIMKAIIFDFDGTVADTLPIIYYSFQTIFKQFDDKDLTDEDVKAMFGPSEVGIINDRLSYENKEKAMETFHRVYADSHAELVKENQEIQELLAFLRENKFKLGVVTGKGRKSLDTSMEILHLHSYFDVAIAGDEVEHAKPHPEGIHKAMELLGAKPEESMYIGDSDADIKAGNQAGVMTVGVQWLPDYQTPEFTEKPDKLFKDIGDFKEFVKGYVT